MATWLLDRQAILQLLYDSAAFHAILTLVLLLFLDSHVRHTLFSPLLVARAMRTHMSEGGGGGPYRRQSIYPYGIVNSHQLPSYHHHRLPSFGQTQRYPVQPVSTALPNSTEAPATVTPGDYMHASYPMLQYENPRLDHSSPATALRTPSAVRVPKMSTDSMPSQQNTQKSKAKGFVDIFTTHFAGDSDALGALAALCQNFNNKVVGEVAFYTGIYKLLMRRQSLHMLADFLEFLPSAWRFADLTKLNNAIENEALEASEFANQNIQNLEEAKDEPSMPTDQAHKHKRKMTVQNPNNQNEKVKVKTVDKKSAVPEAPSKQRKKRPVKDFTTATFTNTDKAKAKAKRVFAGPDELHNTDPRFPNALAASSMCPSHAEASSTVGQKRSRGSNAAQSPGLAKSLFKLPKMSRSDEMPMYVMNSSRPAPVEAKGTMKEAAKTTKAKNTGCGNMLASCTTHFGPVFPTRRAILSRTSRPYIHADCGARFSHPDDVKSHHKKSCTGKARGRSDIGWDNHPSCKVGTRHLNYTKVLDGYVLLDQDSYDKVKAAVAAGLKDVQAECEENMGIDEDTGVDADVDTDASDEIDAEAEYVNPDVDNDAV